MEGISSFTSIVIIVRSYSIIKSQNWPILEFAKKYYVMLDQVLSSMDKLFDQNELNKIGTLENLLIDGANNKKIDNTLKH